MICFENGWIRSIKGHVELAAEQKFKDVTGHTLCLPRGDDDKILLVAANGRFYTLLAANLPGGRGMGEPVRLLVDCPNDAEITDLMIFRAGEKLLVASSAGDGFIVRPDEVLAQTRRASRC